MYPTQHAVQKLQNIAIPNAKAGGLHVCWMPMMDEASSEPSSRDAESLWFLLMFRYALGGHDCCNERASKIFLLENLYNLKDIFVIFVYLC